jgi:hypothetical protein
MADIVTSITLDDSGYQAAAKRVVEANRGIVETQRRVEPATTGSSAAFERLKRSLDPVYDAQKRIERATRDADAAIRAGKATVADKAAMLDRLRAKLDPATDGMRRFSGVANELQSRLAGLGGQAGLVGGALSTMGRGGLAAAAGIGAAALALAAAANQVRANVAHFGQVADDAARLGLAAEDLQALGAAFADGGVSSDTFAAALERLNATVGDALAGSEEAVGKFGRVGISLGELQAAGGDTGEVLRLVADGLRNSGTVAEQTAAAHDLLGRSAGALIPLLSQGSTEVDKLTDAAKQSGQVLGGDVVDG